MKAIKLPRKLKKDLKKEMLPKDTHCWKTSDLKICGFTTNYRQTGKRKITSWSLG